MNVPLEEMSALRTIDYISKTLRVPPFHAKDPRVNAYVLRLESIVDILGMSYAHLRSQMPIAHGVRVRTRINTMTELISAKIRKLSMLVVDFRANQNISYILQRLHLKRVQDLYAHEKKQADGLKKIHASIARFFDTECDLLECKNQECSMSWMVKKGEVNLPKGCVRFGGKYVVCSSICYMEAWRKIETLVPAAPAPEFQMPYTDLNSVD